jgi:polysaccharide export outer membrane protein
LGGPHEWPFAGTGPGAPFGQGAYVDPGRVQHVPEYRLRVDDVVELVYRRTHEETGLYRLTVGDRIRVELPPGTNGAETVNREVVVQPDGDITLPYLGPVRAARLTLSELSKALAKDYERFYKKHIARPTVTPVLIDAKLADLINTVDSRYGAGGQVRVSRVTPDGSIALPAIGSVPVIGLTLDQLKVELGERYQAADVHGIEVQPVLQSRAPRHVFVLGEVRTPGRYTLEGPTTVIQAISLAGGVTTSAAANLKQVVIFRRTQDWQMIATMVDLYDPIIKGKGACAPVCDLWVADADLIIVPKTRILVFDEFVQLVFTQGIYGVIPLQGVSIGFAKTSTL